MEDANARRPDGTRGGRSRRTARLRARDLAGLLLAAALCGCSGIEKAPPQPRAARADRSFELDVPRIMRGTIASETIVLGYNPVVVRGWGLVVGLHGTGSRYIPPNVRAHMLAEMARRGIGQASTGLGDLKPDEMLDSLDTAVVIVEGVVPPGAVGRQVYGRRGRIPGTPFDVRVYALPGSDTTSLEGGHLYTTELRPALSGETLPPTGSRQARAIAEAGGPIFINPFADPDGLDRVAVNRNVGRILDGGEATRDLPLKLRLATPSHARAETIEQAINTRFPQEPGQPDPTAHGESGESIRITVPLSYRSRPNEFIELLRHTTIRLAGAEAVASAVRRAVLIDPSAAVDASWRWQALGNQALPTMQTLYDFAEELPRLAALRAGAKLDDPLVIPHLMDMAENASPDIRRQAVELLGAVRIDPRVDIALRARLDDPDVDVRLAAYEALLKRADPLLTRRAIEDAFVLDVVDSAYPMVYITQVGQPRIVLFGRDMALRQPLLADVWNGRLLLKDVPGDDLIEVYYRTEDGSDRVIQETDPRLEDFVQFLGHQPTIESPRPGLGLSYGQTVGALYQLWRQQCLTADFKADQDRVLAAIRSRFREMDVEARREFADPDFDFLNPEGEGDGAGEPDAPARDRGDTIAPPPAILPPKSASRTP